jgi:methylated-DNA-[protein]-cysteine S-methyltransferase
MNIKLTISRNSEGKITSIDFDPVSGTDVSVDFLYKIAIDDLDLSQISPFQRNVYLELIKIKSGETITYNALAERVGRPGAARAVGTAMARNPFLVVIPCHRVVASKGLGGYACGLDIKRALLNGEAVDSI